MCRMILFFLLFSYSLFAQTKSTSVSLLGGYVGEKSIGGLLLTSIINEKNVYEVGIFHHAFTNTEYKEVKYNTTGLKVGYLYNAFVSRYNFVIIGIGGGGNVGMTKIDNVENYPLVSKDGIDYGVYGVISLDIFLSDKTSFVIRAEENYSVNSTTGNLNPFIGAGFKINF